MLRTQLKPGDVVALTAQGDSHLSVSTFAWYASYLMPLIFSRGGLMLLVRDVGCIRDSHAEPSCPTHSDCPQRSASH